MSVVNANRGEWSELYALAFLLTKGGGYGADRNSQKNEHEYHEVLEIIDKTSFTSQTVYRLSDSKIEIIQEAGFKIHVERDVLQSSMQDFLQDLLSAQSSAAFTSKSGVQILDILKKQRPSASSTLTSDTFLVLKDSLNHRPLDPLAFSIKSEIGNPATVFNASGSTNITYRISGLGNIESIPQIKGLKAKLQYLLRAGCELKFESFDSSVLRKNLENLHPELPEYLAELTLAYYLSNKTKLAIVAESTFPISNPGSSTKVKAIKSFLVAASMGLKANTPWSDYPKDFGGFILVKRDGEVLFYYLQNLSKFEDYLFENLRFETPSTSRHGFGNIESFEGLPSIKLNLQIRF